MQKLYVVTRSDLRNGSILAQSCHAVAEFHKEHPKEALEWQTVSNVIVCLSVTDEDALYHRLSRLALLDVPVATFQEPDLNWSLTSFAALPADEHQAALKDLPLMFHEPALIVMRKQPWWRGGQWVEDSAYNGGPR